MEWWAPGTRRELCPDALSGVELFIVSGRLRPQARASLFTHIYSGASSPILGLVSSFTRCTLTANLPLGQS